MGIFFWFVYKKNYDFLVKMKNPCRVASLLGNKRKFIQIYIKY